MPSNQKLITLTTRTACCLLLFACSLAFTQKILAQRFIGGVAAGINFTQVDGDEVFGYTKLGFNGGPYVKILLDNKQRFSLTMELLFIQKGAYRRVPAPNGARYPFEDTTQFNSEYSEVDKKTWYRLRTDYLEIPLLVHFEDPRSKIGIGVGFAWSRLVYIKEYLWDIRVADSLPEAGAKRLNTAINSGRYYKNDWSVIVDVKLPIYKGLKFNFRFQYSMVPFGMERTFNIIGVNYDDPRIRKPYHNTLTFRIIYSFNEKYKENDNFDKEGKRIGPKWIRDMDAMR